MRFEFREARKEDAEAVADLCNAFERAVAAEPEVVSADDVLRFWRRESERRLVLDGGALVGFAFVQRRGERYDGDGWVHPDAFGRGVGTAIVDWIETRSRELGSPEVRIGILHTDERAACLLQRRGFDPIRSFFRMVIELDEEPEPPAWPEGFDVATLVPGEERVLHQVLEEAFEDHWGHQYRPFEEWIDARALEHELCFLVRSGNAVAAGAECKRKLFGMGGSTSSGPAGSTGAKVSATRCCATHSSSCTGGAHVASASASTPRIPPAPPGSTSGSE